MPLFTTGMGNGAKRARDYWLGGKQGETGAFSPDVLGVLLVTVIWYLIAYFLNDATPSFGPHGNPGWWAWWDQGLYYQTTTELAHAQLKPSTYWYGYPALGAPFYWLLPRHPYLIPNLVMVLAMVWAFYASCRLYMGRLESVLLVYIFIWFDSFLRDECLVIPWNTMPAYCAFFLCIYLLILRPGPGRLADFAICALACGIAMFARPTEIAALSIIYFFGLLKLRTSKEKAQAAGYLGGPALLVGGLTFGLNYYFYHRWGSPYMDGENGKATLANYGLKLYQFVFDTGFLTGDGFVPPASQPRPLLARYPEFFFVLPGLLFLLRDRGWIVWGFILGIVGQLALYLSYNPFNNPPYAWSYGQWHYIAWMLPWLGFATYLSVRRAFFHLPRAPFFVALFLPAFLTCAIGFKAVPLASATAHSGDKLLLLTTYGNGIYTVNLTALAPCDIDDIRLLFRMPPPFNGTDVANLPLMTISVDGRRQLDMVDRAVSQDGNTYHFSFLARGLKLKAGNEIAIQYQVREAPEVEEAQLVGVAFAPLQAVRDYFEDGESGASRSSSP
jgi:hypothetical protein